MNYRHAFHAGNFADLVKHAALLRLLDALQADQAPLRVIDTHAGSGLYDLHGPQAQRSGEAQAGVVRMMAARPDALNDLTQAVATANDGAAEPWLYPGSPWLIARALRPGDTYLACEMQADEHARLAEVLGGRPGVRSLCGDGFAEAARALDPKGRNLVVIDPPFEKADDYDRIAILAGEVLARAPRTAFLIWLPLKDLETFDAFLRDLEDACEPAPLLVVEARMRPLGDPMKMNGCALVLINSPEGLEAPLQAAADWVTAGKPGAEARVWSLG
ncbi:23S rRNA (adenine(2030)-N(6))-methyltransferase RlmJ [Phenylobacterium sp.]|uniref:23S rRNA (adenine(2030)-N(6))-methyltransferase RlmJ n=1 Tax=Phenylobacterium sp. TaxID=1871053 RepID=UPI0027309E53|nr:23S rRNA (adenine(2030)-N(6))-methyltransferase RlmJ [Phenylobacterium sp.]MDP1618772.1 23S rRNA (adenine(2030)-N(6))-methyltransferase RlmJ [Phenylobacterium sp.]MDP1988551.1 23S rRNA (adenine(2030)-N(6))-methyltransferase RlmJ [Phenylobacterium sp.]